MWVTCTLTTTRKIRAYDGICTQRYMGKDNIEVNRFDNKEMYYKLEEFKNIVSANGPGIGKYIHHRHYTKCTAKSCNGGYYCAIVSRTATLHGYILGRGQYKNKKLFLILGFI